jgi:hypothetical protein
MEYLLRDKFAASDEKNKQDELSKPEKKKEKEKKKRTEEEIKKRMEELSQPKDKWKLGRALLSLKKEFPFDKILKKMTEEEWKSNRAFRYPEEYEFYDEEEERKRKLAKYKVRTPYDKLEAHERLEKIQEDKEEREEKFKNRQENWKRNDEEHHAYVKRQNRTEAAQNKSVIDFIEGKVRAFLSLKENWLKDNKEKTTLRNYISTSYRQLIDSYPDEAKKAFPHTLYGVDQKSQTAKKAYPKAFKQCFTGMMSNFIKTENGVMKVRKKPNPFWIPSSQSATSTKLTVQELAKKTVNSKAATQEKTEKVILMLEIQI